MSEDRETWEKALDTLDGGFDDAISNRVPTELENVYEFASEDSDYGYIERSYFWKHAAALATLRATIETLTAERDAARNEAAPDDTTTDDPIRICGRRYSETVHDSDGICSMGCFDRTGCSKDRELRIERAKRELGG